VVGVTFEKAEAAFAEAATIATKVEAAAKLSGDALVKESNELTKVVEAAMIPYPDKKKLQESIMGLKKKVMEASKGGAKAVLEAAKAEAEALAKEAAATPTAPVVKLLTAEADAKALDEAMKVLTAALPEAPLLLLGAGKTLAALAVVPTSLQEKLSAKDWVNESLQVAGGKGGGKAGRGQGAARDASNAAGAKEAAEKFVAEKLS